MTTREELVAALEPDEVDYDRIVRHISPEASAFLPELVAGERLDLAAKATSLAGRLEGDERLATLELAARSRHDVVRVAAAAAAASASLTVSEAELLVPLLLDDADPSVRKLAIRAAAPVSQHAPVREALKRIEEYDPVEGLRDGARVSTLSEENYMASDDEIIERAVARFGPVIDLRTNPQDFIDVVRAVAVDLTPNDGGTPGGAPPPPGPTSMQSSEATLDDVMAEVLNLSRRLTDATGEIAELRGRLER